MHKLMSYYHTDNAATPSTAHVIHGWQIIINGHPHPHRTSIQELVNKLLLFRQTRH